MAFSIFSKPQPSPQPGGIGGGRQAETRSPEKAPAPKKPAAKNGGLVELNARHLTPISRFTVTRYGSPTERARNAAAERTKPSLELSHEQLGFSPALENAALLFASGQAVAARQILGAAVQNEPDSRALALAWHAYFDLLQRANDRAAFEELALEYVNEFERSPPTWVENRAQAAKVNGAATGYFALTQASVKAVLEIPGRAARYAALRIDVVGLSEFDDLGCRRLVDILRRLRRQSYPVSFQGAEHLWPRLQKKLVRGAQQNEGVWLFALELLQWQNKQAEFDELAIDFAVNFEVSPPSWEALAIKQEQAASEAPAVRSEACALKGILLGPADLQVSALYDFAEPRKVVQIDMTQVDRLDFVCAGSLQNAVSNFEAKGKEVHIQGATAIIQALLRLIGIRPEVFKTKGA
jgi:ABC-type transporter Mla MlaB component